MSHPRLGALVAASAMLVLAGCADTRPGGAGTGSDAAWTPPSPASPVEVSAVGTVLEADDGPELCLGPIAESYPPQCSGPPIVGWDWSAVEGEESASGVTWGAYAVRGEWDGETFTVTGDPVLAALHDPMVDPTVPDPWDPTLPPGPLPEAEAQQIQDELAEALPGFLASADVNGRIVAEVMFDDGTIQAAADERYGEDAVVVVSSLKPVDAG